MAIVQNIPPPGPAHRPTQLMPGVVGGSAVLSSAERQSNGIRKRMHHCLGCEMLQRCYRCYSSDLGLVIQPPHDTCPSSACAPPPIHRQFSDCDPIDFYRDLFDNQHSISTHYERCHTLSSSTHLVHILIVPVGGLSVVVCWGRGGVAGVLATRPQPLAAAELGGGASHQGQRCNGNIVSISIFSI